MEQDVICIYSGGMDSFTLAAQANVDGRLHSCLSFYYGQRHSRELEAAALVCRKWGVEHFVVDLTSLGSLLNSTLTGVGEIPEGHYAESNMKQTVVPNRNMIMISIAAGYALSQRVPVVQFGAHAGDHTIYPDCRPVFVDALNGALKLCDWNPVKVQAPFLQWTKGDILRSGLAMDLDYSYTWTCYKGGEIACGVCGSCQERLEAFAENNAEDPLEYASRELIAKGAA